MVMEYKEFFENRGEYGKKDFNKFSICSKLISFGVIGSSSYEYGKLPISNTGNYESKEIVGISVNGNRKGRISPFDKRYIEEIKIALKSGVKTFIADNAYDRNRSFNIGERELYDLLTHNGFTAIELTYATVFRYKKN